MAAFLTYNYTGGASNSDPALSLGGVGSSVEITKVPDANNIFKNVMPVDKESSDDLKYRAIDLYNSGDQIAIQVSFYFTDTPNPESTLAVWYEDTPGQTIPDEDTEPVGASWSEPTVSSQISLPDLSPGSRHRLWIRRTVNQGAAALADDRATLHSWYTQA